MVLAKEETSLDGVTGGMMGNARFGGMEMDG